MCYTLYRSFSSRASLPLTCACASPLSPSPYVLISSSPSISSAPQRIAGSVYGGTPHDALLLLRNHGTLVRPASRTFRVGLPAHSSTLVESFSDVTRLLTILIGARDFPGAANLSPRSWPRPCCSTEDMSLFQVSFCAVEWRSRLGSGAPRGRPSIG